MKINSNLKMDISVVITGVKSKITITKDNKICSKNFSHKLMLRTSIALSTNVFFDVFINNLMNKKAAVTAVTRAGIPVSKNEFIYKYSLPKRKV